MSDRSDMQLLRRLLLRVGIKVVDEWQISLGYVRGSNIYVRGYLVFKTTCIDTEKPLREGAFSFTRRTLFPSQDKRNICDKAKGLLGHFGEVYRGAGHTMP